MPPLVADLSLPSAEWPYLIAIQRLALALAIGSFVGMERQRRGKEAGVRTFAFACLLGCMGALLGDHYALLGLVFVGLLVVFLNLQRLGAHQDTELTTSAALLVIGFTGVMCGTGHTLTPAAVGVLTAALLTWKESFTGFSLGLTEAELRSAILLAILAVVIYPGLPEGAIDPWGFIHPREAWVTVLLIAGIGFANYVLLKLYGNNAVELTGFFGGLVNSTVTVTALASRVGEQPDLADAAYRGVLWATAAMVLRNGVLLAILAPSTLRSAAPPLALMLSASTIFVLIARRKAITPSSASTLQLQSPFSLQSVLKFGGLFLVLQVAGTLAQTWLGQFGFYAVSLVGGMVSSASAVASAALLARQGSESIPPQVAGTGAVLASLMSALVDLPLVARIGKDRRLTRRVAVALCVVAAAGASSAVAEWFIIKE